MISKSYMYALTMCSLALMLSGCGAGGTTPETKNALHESTACISCHDGTSWVTPGTGMPVVTEWMASTHNTGNGAGCADCHDDGFMHPASCSKCHSVGSLAKNPTDNPDRDGKCAKCHNKVNPRPGHFDGYDIMLTADGETPNGVPTDSTTRFAHFSTGTRTSYVSSNYRQNCRKCHNPHYNFAGREQREKWTQSGHGNTRGLARVAIDGKTRGTSIPLNQNFNNRNYCVRCHTSTGFINFVAGDAFTSVNALPDIGSDGLPDPNGFRSNYPFSFKTGSAYLSDQSPYTLTSAGGLGTVRPYADKSREATNCNVCHLDSRSINTADSSSYGGAVRPVALAKGVTIYYSYSSSGKGHSQSVTTVQFDTLGYSNLCLTCHSGRATGRTIRGIDTAYQNNLTLNFVNNPSAPSIHDFAGGAVLQGEKSAFLFYTSPLKYTTAPAHRSINTEGNGPCISCHMPRVQATLSGGTIHSHLFRPVTWNRDDNNDKITDIISFPSVCSRCHAGTSADFAATMNSLRRGFRLSVLLLNVIKVSSTNNWTGQNTNGGLGVTGPTYGNLPVPSLGGLPAGAYTMGANYNYGFLFNEPSAYNHSPILVRQLLYDSFDWLKNGMVSATPFGTSPASVFTAINSIPIPAVGLKWTKADPIQGAIDGTNLPTLDYDVFFAADRDLAFNYICKDYVPGSNVCKRW